mmetsp:Transcript_13457/g.32888  ORF Transcript_13457/g.32888 Transcript_13457/m.32888 type:complete len:337 (-) Transcript_13457:2102-3112(-)
MLTSLSCLRTVWNRTRYLRAHCDCHSPGSPNERTAFVPIWVEEVGSWRRKWSKHGNRRAPDQAKIWRGRESLPTRPHLSQRLHNTGRPSLDPAHERPLAPSFQAQVAVTFPGALRGSAGTCSPPGARLAAEADARTIRVRESQLLRRLNVALRKEDNPWNPVRDPVFALDPCLQRGREDVDRHQVWITRVQHEARNPADFPGVDETVLLALRNLLLLVNELERIGPWKLLPSFLGSNFPDVLYHGTALEYPLPSIEQTESRLLADVHHEHGVQHSCGGPETAIRDDARPARAGPTRAVASTLREHQRGSVQGPVREPSVSCQDSLQFFAFRQGDLF